jgi:hypothetical protein
MGINNFKILEKVGVADSTTFYVDPIFNKTWNEFLKFYQSDENKISKDFPITYSEIKPNLDLRNIADRMMYAKFPVVGIELNLVFRKMTEDNFYKKYKYSISSWKKNGKTLTYTVGGFAVNFGHRNWSGYSRLAPPVKQAADHGVILNCGISVDLAPNFNLGLYKNKIQDQIEETIWHELNHLYEYYNRVLVKSGTIVSRGPSTAITEADANKWGIPKDIYNFWIHNFVYYLYTSEQHELNAQVQEVAFWVKKYGFDKIQKTTAWGIANRMEKFDASIFLKGLDREIDTYISSKSIETTALRSNGLLSHPIKERLKNMWIQQYEKMLKKYNENPTVPLQTLKKMKCDEFTFYFQKRINKSGTYLKKKISKLYIIDPNDDEEIY